MVTEAPPCDKQARPGRQLPQAKPGWWLFAGASACGVFPASRSGNSAVVLNLVEHSRCRTWTSAAGESFEKASAPRERTEIEPGGRLLAQLPSVLLRVIDSGTSSSSPRAGDPGAVDPGAAIDSRKLSLKQPSRAAQRIEDTPRAPHPELQWLFEDSRTRGAASLVESAMQQHVHGSSNGRRVSGRCPFLAAAVDS
jgi:hypothetical protein